MKTNFAGVMALCCGVVIAGQPNTATAEQIGYGRLFVNDFIGDGQDRWRSGSIVGSHVFGQVGQSNQPEAFGDVIELRILGQVIAPDNLQVFDAGDRRYAGALSLGAHTHWQQQGVEFSLGADVTLVGPSTGLAELQSGFHDLIGLQDPADAVFDNQIGDKVVLTGVTEVGYTFDLGGNASLRPFVEARIGDETLMRAGFDLVIGQFGQDEMLVRDPVSGQRYQTIRNNQPGWSLIAGADVAHVDGSIYLPASSVTMEERRERYRLGLNWQGGKASVYYGATWLSPEFAEQGEGQVVGAVRIKLRF